MNQLREWNGKCQNCFTPTEQHTMSMFDVRLICLECAEQERSASPQYFKVDRNKNVSDLKNTED